MECWKARQQHGDIIIFFALLIPLILAIVSFVIDAGAVYATHSRLQNATDAAAIAGAYQLDDDAKVKETVHAYLQKNTQEAYDSIVYSTAKPTEERVAAYNYDTSKEDELDVTMHALVPLTFCRWFDIYTLDVSATSKAKVSREGLTDEMFKYSMVAAHKSPANYDPNDWQSRQKEYGIWFDAEGMVIEGDIMTNGKIVFNQSSKSYLKGKLNVSKDAENSGKEFSQGFWRNGQYVTKDYKPSVWGAYGWNNGQMEWYTLLDDNGQPLTRQTTAANGHLEDVKNQHVVKQDKDIDISIKNNASIKALLDGYKAMSVSEREKQHIYYDDNKSNGYYNFSSSHTRVYPALTSNETGRVVSGNDTDIPTWERYYTTIVVPNDIQVSFENSPEPSADDFAIIVSLHGNIHIPNGVTFRGLLYAPEGTVRIDGTAKVDGNVIAQQILMSTPGQNVKGKNYVHHATMPAKGRIKVRLVS